MNLTLKKHNKYVALLEQPQPYTEKLAKPVKTLDSEFKAMAII